MPDPSDWRLALKAHPLAGGPPPAPPAPVAPPATEWKPPAGTSRIGAELLRRLTDPDPPLILRRPTSQRTTLSPHAIARLRVALRTGGIGEAAETIAQTKETTWRLVGGLQTSRTNAELIEEALAAAYPGVGLPHPKLIRVAVAGEEPTPRDPWPPGGAPGPAPGPAAPPPAPPPPPKPPEPVQPARRGDGGLPYSALLAAAKAAVPGPTYRAITESLDLMTLVIAWCDARGVATPSLGELTEAADLILTREAELAKGAAHGRR